MAKRKKKPQIGPEFMRRTQFQNLEPSGQQRGMPPPEPELPFHGETLALPDPKTVAIQSVGLNEAIDNRKSERVFLERNLTTGDLSYLLWATQGVKEIDQGETFRTVPSAGARHAFETFLVVRNVDDLEPGLYRYLALSHRLGIVNRSAEIAERIARTTLQPELMLTSAVTFIWTAVVGRMSWRYGDRSYRYLHLDAGHVGHSLYLAVQAVGCKTCTSAAFNDDDLNRILGLDGVQHFALYYGSVGK
jgi:SagB-type dehydrogenase family enzyme